MIFDLSTLYVFPSIGFQHNLQLRKVYMIVQYVQYGALAETRD